MVIIVQFFNEKDKLFADVGDFITNCQKNNTFDELNPKSWTVY